MARTATPLKAIRLLVLDVDGVLTDGRLSFGPAGEIYQTFHVRDGVGIKALAAEGVTVAVISGRKSAAVTHRCAELGITEVQQGITDKSTAFTRLLARLNLAAGESACVGDDTLDIPLLQRAGLGVAVADAHREARRAAHRTTKLAGGAGAVREVCDWLLAARRRARPRSR